jgi:hypothetical protein
MDKELINELWSLWESMAECGELKIGPQFSANYKRLKGKVSEVKQESGEGNIIEFLCGEKSFEGTNFGDDSNSRGGKYWWRKPLREYISKLESVAEGDKQEDLWNELVSDWEGVSMNRPSEEIMPFIMSKYFLSSK